MPHDTHPVPAQAITQPPMHHFGGYYDKCCWNRSGRYIYAHEVPFRERNPEPNEPVTIGVVDLEDGGAFKPLTETRAWNWQQGAMLRWLPPDEDRVLVFNDRRDDHFSAVMHDVDQGEVGALPWPVYDVASHGRLATSMNFVRVTHTRPGYGYFTELEDPFGQQLSPSQDGVYVVDVQQRVRTLLLSMHDMLDLGEVRPPKDHKAWVNCLNFNPSGTRFLFLHRWGPHAISGHEGFFTRMLTINADGSDPAVLLEGLKISHFDWYDDEHILVWLESPERGIHDYCMVHDPSGEIRKVGEGLFQSDGHCNLSPDRQWMVTDTYPKGPNNEQALILYHLEQNRRVDIGAYRALSVPDDAMRCDLHTRWNRDGTQLCFDSTHEGSRQLYVADVSDVADVSEVVGG